MRNNKIKFVDTPKLFWSFMALIRWKNLGILAAAQYGARMFLVDRDASLLQLVFEKEIFILTLATSMVMAAGYIINDYIGIRIDLANDPKKVVFERRIKRKYGLLLYVALQVLWMALVLWQLSANVVLYLLVGSITIFLYSFYAKRALFWANLLYSALIYMAFLLIMLYYDYFKVDIQAYACFAMVLTLARVLIQDIADIKGDKSYGRSTLPVAKGIDVTIKVVYGLLVILVMGILLSFRFFQLLHAVYLLTIIILPLFYCMYRLFLARTRKDYLALYSTLKTIMVLGLLSMPLTYYNLKF